jgi:hypothetical protein
MTEQIDALILRDRKLREEWSELSARRHREYRTPINGAWTPTPYDDRMVAIAEEINDVRAERQRLEKELAERRRLKAA